VKTTVKLSKIGITHNVSVITETNACDSMESVQHIIRTLERALGTFNTDIIDLIFIRVNSLLLSDGVICDQF
jgi:predicted oxidoreductase